MFTLFVHLCNLHVDRILVSRGMYSTVSSVYLNYLGHIGGEARQESLRAMCLMYI